MLNALDGYILSCSMFRPEKPRLDIDNLPIILERLGDEVFNNVPWINSGGCGVYAAQIALILSDHKIDCWGKVINYNSSTNVNINEARKNNALNTVMDWESQGIRFNHIMVQFRLKGKIFTHDCTITTTDYKLNFGEFYEGEITPTELARVASVSHGWNPMFNRTQDIPRLRKIVAKHIH